MGPDERNMRAEHAEYLLREIIEASRLTGQAEVLMAQARQRLMDVVLATLPLESIDK